MSWITSYRALVDFVSLVIVHAPSDFPKEDFLPDNEQLDLEGAFEELQKGLAFVPGRNAHPETIAEMRILLSDALGAYREGRELDGVDLLHKFEQKLKDLRRR
jgi:hypothetical protein